MQSTDLKMDNKLKDPSEDDLITLEREEKAITGGTRQGGTCVGKVTGRERGKHDEVLCGRNWAKSLRASRKNGNRQP